MCPFAFVDVYTFDPVSAEAGLTGTGKGARGVDTGSVTVTAVCLERAFIDIVTLETVSLISEYTYAMIPALSIHTLCASMAGRAGIAFVDVITAHAVAGIALGTGAGEGTVGVMAGCRRSAVVGAVNAFIDVDAGAFQQHVSRLTFLIAHLFDGVPGASRKYQRTDHRGRDRADPYGRPPAG